MTGAELKDLRLKLNLSQSKLGEMVGISKSAVSKLENGTNRVSKPVEIHLRKLESAFTL